jgi:hypothetical protein
MAKPLLCLLLFAAFISYARQQTKSKTTIQLPLNGSFIEYSEWVTPEPHLSKEQLFGNVLKWYKHNFQSADNTLTVDNFDSGKLSGTGIIHQRRREKQVLPGDLFFIINLTIKDGAWKYAVDSIYGFEKAVRFYYSDMYNEEMYPPPKPKWQQQYRTAMLTSMDKRIKAMINRLKNEINEQ